MVKVKVSSAGRHGRERRGDAQKRKKIFTSWDLLDGSEPKCQRPPKFDTPLGLACPVLRFAFSQLITVDLPVGRESNKRERKPLKPS